MLSWPFTPIHDRNRLTSFKASGFDHPVPGIVYDGALLDGGIPLGGLGTGYFTLEGNGKIGHCSIYNDIVPPRVDHRDWLTIRTNGYGIPLSTAEIVYWGHFPMADLIATLPQQPLAIGIRAFSPFVVGDAAASNTPAALFELDIRNTGDEDTTVQLVIAPPRPPESHRDAIAVIGQLVGQEDTDLIASVGDDTGVAETGTIPVPAGDSVRVRIAIAWYVPEWRDSSREPHVHRYGQRFVDAEDVATSALATFDATLNQILAWQGAVYDSGYPDWVKDWLIQSLYSLTKNTVWIARTRKDEWWGEDGWFTHNESHTGCPITETMVCRMHGHFPTLFFFPELEASTLDAFRHFQISDGEIPFSYGMQTSMRDPRYHCQHPLNSGQYAQMILRQYLRTGDQEQLAYFYGSAKRAINYQFSLDDDDDGLVNDQPHLKPGEHWPANQFYDVWPWWGTSAYVAGTWLATLACGKRLAEEAGDSGFAATCDGWLQRGLASYEQKLWNGEYYRLWNDPENHRVSEVSLGNQLMVQWCTKVVGLPDLLQAERIDSALRAVERLNVTTTQYGLVNGVTPDGERFDSGRGPAANGNDHAKQTFVGEGLCAAMTQIYHGRGDIGAGIARQIYESIMVTSRSPWNQRCLIDSETGLPVWGDDYYSNLVVWALPMALSSMSVAEFTDGDSLVNQMLIAARLGSVAGSETIAAASSAQVAGSNAQ